MSDQETTIEDLKEQIRRIIKKANRSIRAAKRLVEDEDFDFALSRLYYAVFYAMEAALLTKNFSSSKHTGVISEFNRLFVKEGIFPKHFSKTISRLFRERQVGDYGFYIDISDDDMDESVKLAENFLEEIEEYLKKEKFL